MGCVETTYRKNITSFCAPETRVEEVEEYKGSGFDALDYTPLKMITFREDYSTILVKDKEENKFVLKVLLIKTHKPEFKAKMMVALEELTKSPHEGYPKIIDFSTR
jgi:hypothetical protein